MDLKQYISFDIDLMLFVLLTCEWEVYLLDESLLDCFHCCLTLGIGVLS
jgi:hypothetical protein